MSLLTRIALVATAVLAPTAIAHALSSWVLVQPIGIATLVVLETLGFACLLAALRPRPSGMVIAAVFYFPFVFALIFAIGVRAGYYDFP